MNKVCLVTVIAVLAGCAATTEVVQLPQESRIKIVKSLTVDEMRKVLMICSDGNGLRCSGEFKKLSIEPVSSSNRVMLAQVTIIKSDDGSRKDRDD